MTILRRGRLCALFLFGISMEVCGEAENGKQAIEKVKQLKPDLVLLDINMPVMNGVQAAYEIRRIAPSTKIIFFTIHDSPKPYRRRGSLGLMGLPQSRCRNSTNPRSEAPPRTGTLILSASVAANLRATRLL